MQCNVYSFVSLSKQTKHFSNVWSCFSSMENEIRELIWIDETIGEYIIIQCSLIMLDSLIFKLRYSTLLFWIDQRVGESIAGKRV